MVYDGYWHTPEREMLQAAVDEAQKDVTGTARVKLYKGTCCTAGRRSARSLYRLDMATFEEDDVYRQKDAEGFIRLNALRLAIRSEEHTSELQSQSNLVCRLLLEKKKKPLQPLDLQQGEQQTRPVQDA